MHYIRYIYVYTKEVTIMSVVRFGPISSADEAKAAGCDTGPIWLEELLDPVYRVGQQ